VEQKSSLIVLVAQGCCTALLLQVELVAAALIELLPVAALVLVERDEDVWLLDFASLPTSHPGKMYEPQPVVALLHPLVACLALLRKLAAQVSLLLRELQEL